jgi:predicted RNA-binding protein with RPS1 domain
MAGGEGAKERRRLKRLVETSIDATPDKNQGKNSRDNKYTSTNRKDSSTRQQNGRNTTGNRFNKYDKNNNNNNKTRSNTKCNNTTPAKKKVKKPKHLKRKLEQASKENDKAVETIKKEMQDFEYKKGIIRNNSKRQRIDADDDGADTMFVVGPNTPGVFSRTKKADVEDADTTMVVVGPNTPGVYGNNKNNAESKPANDDEDDDDDDIDMIDDKAETKSDDDSDSSVDSSSDDDSSNEEKKDDVGESHKRKETITNDGSKKINSEIKPIKEAEIKSTKNAEVKLTKKVEIKPIKKAEVKSPKKVEIKPIKKAEIKSPKKVEIKPINNDDDKAKTKSDSEEKKNDAGESLQRKEKIVAPTVTDNEQDMGKKSISECIEDASADDADDANVSEKDDDESDDSDSDDDNDEPQKRQRGRGRKGQQDTAKKIEETEAIEKVKTDNNNPSDDTTEKGKTRYCVGRKPVTDYTLGSSYPAEVVYVKPFGVFFDIGCHSDAFCHVSRLRDDFVESPESMFKEGDKVEKVRVVEIDRRRKRITVSLQSESRVQDERKSIDARRTRTDSRKLKARKNEARFQSKPTTTDHIEQSIQKKEPVISIQKKEPVVIRAPAYAPRAPAYAPTKTYNDPSMMAPADLKRARKLARRAERRSKAEA